MTLIAKTTRKGFPFLVSDILFTSEEGKEGLRVPIDIGDAQQYIENMEWKPMFHAQKLYILTPDLSIAMAGDYYQMRDFLRDLRIHVRYYDHISTAVMGKILIDIDASSQMKNSAFLIYITERNGSQIKSFTFTHPQEAFIKGKSVRFESIVACGSGANDFLDFNEEEGTFDPYPEGLDAAFVANVEMLARLMAHDVATLQNLNNAWGSGFEVAYCTRTGLHKASNLAYVVLKAEKDECGTISGISPQKIFHVNYEDDNMIYSSLDFNNYQITEDRSHLHFLNSGTANSVYLVEPIDVAEAGLVEVQNYAFKTDKIAIVVTLKLPDGSYEIDGVFLVGGANTVTYNPNGFALLSIPKNVFNLLIERHAMNKPTGKD